MCGLTSTAQESLGRLTVCGCGFVCALNLSSILGGVGILGLVGPPGRHYHPPTYPHGLNLPIPEGPECHLLLQASCFIWSLFLLFLLPIY